MQPYQLISGMWSIREPSCPEGPNRGNVWKAAWINAAQTGNDFWLDNIIHPWAISTEKTPQILPPAPPLLHDSQIMHFASPKYTFRFFKQYTAKYVVFRKIFARAEWENTFFTDLVSSWDVLPCFYIPREKQHALWECHCKSVMDIITKNLDTAASGKEIWHKRGSLHLCLKNTPIIHNIWLNPWSKRDRK